MSTTVHNLPQHLPAPRELDDVELLRMNAFPPTTGFGPSESLLTLTIPTSLAVQAVAAGGLTITDPEGVPLAVLDIEDSYRRGPDCLGMIGLVRPLPGKISRPFNSCYRSPEQAHTDISIDALVVPVVGPLTAADLDAVCERAAGRAIAFLALTGTGTPVGVSEHGLVHVTLVAAESLTSSTVIAVPVAARENPHDNQKFYDQVVRSYAEERDVLWPRGIGQHSPAVQRVLDTEHRSRVTPGLVVFFTGLSGSGKSTIAQALRNHVLEHGLRSVSLLDGDRVRRNLSAGLTFSPADRETNITRIGWVAAEISRHGGMAICSPIAPYERTRGLARSMVEDAGGVFVLIHVATPLAECERRDRKGLYATARRGELDNFTGITAPYETPHDADLRIDTTKLSIAEARDEIVGFLAARGYLEHTSTTQVTR